MNRHTCTFLGKFPFINIAGVMPFPKLLLRKRLWIGAVTLLLVAGFYFYFSFWEVCA